MASDQWCISDVQPSVSFAGVFAGGGNAVLVPPSRKRSCISDDRPSIPFAGVFEGGGNAALVPMAGNRCSVSDVQPLDLAANVGYAAMAAMVLHWRNERCKSDVKRKRGTLRRGALGAAQRGAERCVGGYSINLPDVAPTWRSFLQTRLLPHLRAHFWAEKCCNLRVCTDPHPKTVATCGFAQARARKPLQPAGLHKPASENRCSLGVCTDPRLKSVATCGFAEKAARKALRMADLQIITSFRVTCRFRRRRRVVMKGLKRIKTAFWSPCVVTGGLKRIRQTRKPPDLLRRSAKNRSNLVTDRAKRIGSAEKCGFCMFGRSVWGPA